MCEIYWLFLQTNFDMKEMYCVSIILDGAIANQFESFWAMLKNDIFGSKLLHLPFVKGKCYQQPSGPAPLSL